MIPGETVTSGPCPMPCNPNWNVPALVRTTRGACRMPGYAGWKLTETVQTEPAGTVVVPPTAHPDIPLMGNSCTPPWDRGTEMLLMVTVEFTKTDTGWAAAMLPISVTG